jgi:hypothetical protein
MHGNVRTEQAKPNTRRKKKEKELIVHSVLQEALITEPAFALEVDLAVQRLFHTPTSMTGGHAVA